MADLTIKTNHVPRLLMYGHEIPESQRGDFDYLDDIEDSSFVKYRGQIYDLGTFMRCPKTGELADWDGYHADSFFSGILVKYVDGGEVVILATYYS